MKKLFTLVALLTVFLGAKAVNWDEVKKIDYQGLTDFPYYIMGYAPEMQNGIMVDNPVPYRKLWRADDKDFTDEIKGTCTEVTINGGTFFLQMLESNPWRQYFAADGVATEIGSNYKVVARVKVSQDCTVHVNMGNWSSALGVDVPFPASDDFQDVEWTYDEIPVASCFIIAQPGVTDAVIEWESITVYKQRKEGGRPEEWLEDIENGNAETPWTDEQKAIAYNDMEKNFTICAWSKEKGRNIDETDEKKPWNPFPAPIVVDPKDETNHVFLCDGQPATTEGDASAWDNQFWIQSKHAWKSGLSMKIKFRYMASADVSSTDTQIHKQTPSDYLIWHAIGNIHFTEEWQTFDDKMSIGDDMAGGWSIAFNLNSKVKDAVKFYFDDLSWQYLKLDEGYFVSGINTNTTTSYDDLDNAIEFTKIDDLNLEAVVGEKGKNATYVDQLMISTTRGADAAFKGATLKPERKIANDPEDWNSFTPAANAKLDVPGLGVWKVYIDLEYNAMAFEMLEGTAYEEQDPVDVYTFADEIVVNGKERDYLPADKDGNPQEAEIGEGQPWDNQFFIVADRVVKAGEATTIKFQYKATVAGATSGTQSHGEPGGYIHWAAIGSLTFAEEWQDFENDFTIPAECDGSEGKQFKSIAFNLAEIKGACDYSFKNIQWYLKDASLDAGKTYENLISGSTNFYKKEGAGTNPYTGIETVTAKTAKTSAVLYNIAGQRVNKNYKGLVVKDGKKVVLK